ncbi:MAG: S-methyl-5-thioribose-1-phosphate isomerase [Rhodocyclaceae bacterium]|nr:S-methyl-5-thioribose-1-phosphate isomerase [Rhodocyclaceae bacterium]
MTQPHSFFPIREEGGAVLILDQTELPHRRVERELADLEAAAHAIRSMQVRGAPLIGATAAWGLALAMARDPSDSGLNSALALLGGTRPTAVNLRWALERLKAVLLPLSPSSRAEAARSEARKVCLEDEAANRAIGQHGLKFITDIAGGKAGAVRVMTHCNAGALATVAWGTALAPVYAAKQAGVPVHVWVSETRPRNQGLLTAWEMREAGIPHTYMADNAAAHLIGHGQVDLVIVGADRIAANGDVANKVGTCLKALACREWGVPFHVAAPSSTLDWHCPNGAGIPIEERSGDEVRRVAGAEGAVTIIPEDSPVANPAFDVTPARMVTAIITERGAVAPDRLSDLYPERKP